MLAVVTLIAGALRLPLLSRPAELVFDEIFYARDACRYVLGTESACGISELVSRSHPPLGKWLIGTGIAAFGNEPFGWRVAAALAGTLTVALTFILAWRLLSRLGTSRAGIAGAAVAALLLATDFLHLVQSRIAMLDAFITLFVVGAVLGVVLDRDRPRARHHQHLWQRVTVGRPWLILAGASLGAAAATKWSGAYVAPAIIGLLLVWEAARQRRVRPAAGWKSWAGALRREAGPVAVLLGLLPLLVYLASYIGRMPGELVALPWEAGSVWRGIWSHQRAMLDFHTALGGDHPYQSPAWSWPLVMRPVAYWFVDEGGTYREILALGNPLVWWPGFAALLALGLTWWRAGWSVARPEPTILAAAGATYLPWLVLSGDRSQTFIWYLLPTIPFLCLALGLVAVLAWDRVASRLVGLVYGALVIASVVVYLPLLTGLPLDPDAWRSRLLFTDCERPGGPDRSLPDDSSSEGEPAPGWCWI
jgi:dolichyl-phosphate-mannose-protein mannosyltransferase